jgi:hypothetical protein
MVWIKMEEILLRAVLNKNFYIFLFMEHVLKCMKYIIFLFYNTKISDNNAESRKVPRMLALNGKVNPLEKEFL